MLLGGCATAPKQEEVRLVWPPPPLTPRIEFVRSVVSEKTSTRTPPLPSAVAFLGGDKPPPNRIVEPMGLAVSDDGQRLYVSDYAQLPVFVFDFGQKDVHKIGEKERCGRPAGLPWMPRSGVRRGAGQERDRGLHPAGEAARIHSPTRAWSGPGHRH